METGGRAYPTAKDVTVRPLLSLLLLVCACATQSAPRAASPLAAPPPSAPQAPPRPACSVGDTRAALGSLRERSSSDVIAELGTDVDPYRLQDGVWLAGAPILVNEPFDFGT